MLDPKNVVIITGGIVQDPEVINDNIVKLRVAIDYAGSEKGSQNNSGYFDVTYYLNNDDNARNAQFVRNQIKDQKMKKGSQVSLQGRLVQERWSAEDGSNRNRIVVVAEAITYAGGGKPQSTEDGNTAAPTAAINTPGEF